MNIQELTDALTALGFTSGYAVKDAEAGSSAEIIFWENENPQPTEKELLAAVARGASLRLRKNVEEARRAQYQKEADPLFFKWQAGETTEQEWLDARAAVVAANPYPEETN